MLWCGGVQGGITGHELDAVGSNLYECNETNLLDRLTSDKLITKRGIEPRAHSVTDGVCEGLAILPGVHVPVSYLRNVEVCSGVITNGLHPRFQYYLPVLQLMNPDWPRMSLRAVLQAGRGLCECVAVAL